jgi:hypothetical protein
MVFAAINSFVPKIVIRNSNRPPWIRGELVFSIRDL